MPVFHNGAVEIAHDVTGQGPAVLLLHGFPQNRAMWGDVVPALSQRFTCVTADLRGYGASSKPEATDPATYSFREMARDMTALMSHLGHETFHLIGHDRGGRVAYRLALDHPERVKRLAILDILPTSDYWARMDRGFALKIYHWTLLAQPSPLPETLIGGAPDFWLEWTLKTWTVSQSLDCFGPEAMAHYRQGFHDPARLTAMSDDFEIDYLEGDELTLSQKNLPELPTVFVPKSL